MPNCAPDGHLYTSEEVHCVVNKNGHNMYWTRGRDRAGRKRVSEECVDTSDVECTLSKSQIRDQENVRIRQAESAIQDTLRQTDFVTLNQKLQDALLDVETGYGSIHVAPAAKKALLKQLEKQKLKLVDQYNTLFDYKLLQAKYNLQLDQSTIAKDILFFDDSKRRIDKLRNDLKSIRSKINVIEKEQQVQAKAVPQLLERIVSIPTVIDQITAQKEQLQQLINVPFEEISSKEFQTALGVLNQQLQAQYKELFKVTPYLTLLNQQELQKPFVETINQDGKNPIQHAEENIVQAKCEQDATLKPEQRLQKREKILEQLKPLTTEVISSLDPFEQYMTSTLMEKLHDVLL